MSTTCKYCNDPENKQDNPGLICETCVCFVHLKCLRSQCTPGEFSGDVFFDFTCEDCSPDKTEVFTRNKFPWVNVILLTLHHLGQHATGISNNGYFHYKTHICSFIDRYWSQLFGPQFKQKKNWIGTIAGALSVYNHLFFRSGSYVLGEQGWWKLQHAFSPAVAAHILQEVARDKPKGRPRNQLTLDKTLFHMKITELGYHDLLVVEFETPILAKKKRLELDDIDSASNTSYMENLHDSDSRTDMLDDMNIAPLEELPQAPAMRDTFSDVEIIFRGFDYQPTNQLPMSETSSTHSFQQSAVNYDSDRSCSSAHHLEPQSDDYEEKVQSAKKRTIADTKPKKTEEKQVVKRESLFSTELNSIDLPWEEKEPEPNNDLVEMTPYEEIQLLKQVESMVPRVKDVCKKAHLSRLRAKLALRRLKRHKHLPLFDLDKSVKLLGGYVTEDSRLTNNAERVLDRFQRSYLLDNLCGTIASTNYGTLLLSHIEPTPFRSAYSDTILKPYIRRDTDSKPTWLQLTDELLRRTHKHIKNYEPPPRATIDYSYVRPQHIAAVNNLCAQFFWPGIDVTEALQYPEFSCVVTYKRVVVGCAFLVPDVGRNEAYISFVLTRPEWRNAKIASFMLYHLLQTCTGKDVTLHVSPTNPAIFLYQKFGFKVEELIQDFYEKYYDIDYKGCRHALFLRLVR